MYSIEQLNSLLLSFGGERAVLPRIEEDLKNIIERGRTFPASRALMRRGFPNQCHHNSSMFWDDYRTEGCKLCTGYALSDDGIWRQHSWCFFNGRVIETTMRRKKYFGFEMSREEASEFFWDNYL